MLNRQVRRVLIVGLMVVAAAIALEVPTYGQCTTESDGARKVKICRTSSGTVRYAYLYGVECCKMLYQKYSDREVIKLKLYDVDDAYNWLRGQLNGAGLGFADTILSELRKLKSTLDDVQSILNLNWVSMLNAIGGIDATKPLNCTFVHYRRSSSKYRYTLTGVFLGQQWQVKAYRQSGNWYFRKKLPLVGWTPWIRA